MRTFGHLRLWGWRWCSASSFTTSLGNAEKHGYADYEQSYNRHNDSNYDLCFGGQPAARVADS